MSDMTQPLAWAEASLGQKVDQTRLSQRKSTLEIPWKDWCWSSNTLATWCKRSTHWKRPYCWERLRAGGEADDRGWDGWLASLTQWTWVWASSRRWWRTGKPGVLQSMGLQRVGHDWATELNWTDDNVNNVVCGEESFESRIQCSSYCSILW